MIYLDTHVVVWLYASGAASLSETAIGLIEGHSDIRVSPIVRLELRYLTEIRRINEDSATLLNELERTIGLRTCDAPFEAVVKQAERHAWTRDPFDRLIVAQADLNNAALVTKDEVLRDNYPNAVW